MSAHLRARRSGAPAGGTATAASASAQPAISTALFKDPKYDLLEERIDHGALVIEPTNTSAGMGPTKLAALMSQHTALGNPNAYGQFDEDNVVHALFLMNEDIRNKMDFFADGARAAAAQNIRNIESIQTDLLARAQAPPAPAASTALVTNGDAAAAAIVSALENRTPYGQFDEDGVVHAYLLMNEDIRNKLDFFANVGRAAAAQSIRNFDGVQTNWLARAAQRAPRAATPGVASAPPRGCFSRVPNPQHNVTLLGTFNDMTGVTCQAIKRRICEGTTSEMVESKVKQNGKSCGPMCLAYHVRGNCSENCGKAYDHVPYTDAEYQASGLIEWCTENWVADIAAPE